MKNPLGIIQKFSFDSQEIFCVACLTAYVAKGKGQNPFGGGRHAVIKQYLLLRHQEGKCVHIR